MGNKKDGYQWNNWFKVGEISKEAFKNLKTEKENVVTQELVWGNAREWEVVMSAKSSEGTRVIKSSPVDLFCLRVYLQMLSGLGKLNLFMKNKRRSEK